MLTLLDPRRKAALNRRTSSRSGRPVLGMALCGVVLCSPALGQEPAERVPPGTPVVLISIDTLRADRLPIYGNSGVRTPAIDALRRDGILFERAYSPVPLTLPTHVSLLSGEQPTAHGVRDNLGYELADHLEPWLPDRLRRLGYETGAAVSAFVLRSETGLARGFDFFEDRLIAPERATAAQIQRPGAETLDAVLPWLGSVADRPFLLFFHLYEPHAPYEPPEPFASAYDSPYDGEIAAADRVVGKLVEELERLDLYDRTLVVLLSDHGEGLGEHGEQEHGVLLYRQTLQVPLILKLPGGRRAGESISTPVEITDVAPTILSLLADEADSERAARSLLGALPAGRAIYSETFYPWLRFGWSYLLSLVSGRYHYVQGPDPELYDLVEDPDETRNLVAERPELARDMRRRLAQLHIMPEDPGEADEHTRSALRSLGYLTSSSSRRSGPLPDPKTRIHVLDAVAQAMDVLSAGHATDAVSILRDVVGTDPGLIDAWQLLGLALQQLGRTEEALAAFREAYALSGGEPPELAGTLAQLELELGRPLISLEILAAALAEAPESATLHLGRARVLFELERFREALRNAEEALRLSPEDPQALYLRGRIHWQRDDLGPAESDFRAALALEPGLADAARDLAVLLMETGRPEEAVEILGARADETPRIVKPDRLRTTLTWNAGGRARRGSPPPQ